MKPYTYGLSGKTSLSVPLKFIDIQNIYGGIIVKFLYQDAHFTIDPLAYATLDYIYSIQFEIPNNDDPREYIRLIEEMDRLFKNEMKDHNFFYLSPCDDGGFAIFMECSEKIDNILIKLNITSQVVNQHTKEEYNKSVYETNKKRKLEFSIC